MDRQTTREQPLRTIRRRWWRNEHDDADHHLQHVYDRVEHLRLHRDDRMRVMNMVMMVKQTRRHHR